jgi:hypothetical protein
MKNLRYGFMLLLAAACATVDEQPDTVIHRDADVSPDMVEEEAPADLPDFQADPVAEDQTIDPAGEPFEDPASDPDVTPDPPPDLDVDSDPDLDPDPDPDPAPDPEADETGGGSGTCADPFIMPGPGLYTGDTTGAPQLHDPFCDGWQQSSSEHVWLLAVASSVSAHFHLHPAAHWDPSIYINGDCNVTSSTTPAFCADALMWDEDEDLWADLTPGDWYVFIDGYISTGPYELTVTY